MRESRRTSCSAASVECRPRSRDSARTACTAATPSRMISISHGVFCAVASCPASAEPSTTAACAIARRDIARSAIDSANTTPTIASVAVMRAAGSAAAKLQPGQRGPQQRAGGHAGEVARHPACRRGRRQRRARAQHMDPAQQRHEQRQRDPALGRDRPAEVPEHRGGRHGERDTGAEHRGRGAQGTRDSALLQRQHHLVDHGAPPPPAPRARTTDATAAAAASARSSSARCWNGWRQGQHVGASGWHPRAASVSIVMR